MKSIPRKEYPEQLVSLIYFISEAHERSSERWYN